MYRSLSSSNPVTFQRIYTLSRLMLHAYGPKTSFLVERPVDLYLGSSRSAYVDRDLDSYLPRGRGCLGNNLNKLPPSSRRLTTMAKRVYPEPQVIPAITEHKATVFVLHGLGDNSRGVAPLAGRNKPAWGASLPQVKFIVPNAPTRPITVNGGEYFTAWFDVTSLSDDNKLDQEGLEESFRYLTDLIEKEIAQGIPSDRIVIIGYSLGGAMALSMLRSEHKFAGIMGLSCFLPVINGTPPVSPQNKSTPVIMCHGVWDRTLAFEFGQKSFEVLKQELDSIQFKHYFHDHMISPEELEDTAEYLETWLNK